MATVSVIIPTYNRETFVVETVASVLAQTLRDYEVVVVDDGSTDATQAVLKRFGDGVTYLYQENGGRSSARNRGIEHTTGKYVVFLDSDDLLLPHALEKLTSSLDDRPDVGLVYSDGYYCDASGQDFRRLSSLRPEVDLGNPLETLVLMNFIIAPHSAMVRRSCLDLVGPPYFDEALTGPEDTDLWIRLAASGCRFEYVDDLVCKYRWHGVNTFSAGSETAPRAWASMRRFKYKVLHADYFPRLSLETRRMFFYQLLLHNLRDDLERQQAILESSPFKALPKEVQAVLWYLVGVDNIIEADASCLGCERLERACQLAPRCVKYRSALLAAQLGDSVLGDAVRLRRRLGCALGPEPPIRSPFDFRFLEKEKR